MEDAHCCELDLKPEGADGKVTDAKTRVSFFGVYDGHGGERVAIYTGQNLHKIVAKQNAFKDLNFEQALKDGFLATDRALLSGKVITPTVQETQLRRGSDPKFEDEVSGCTATVGILTHDKIYVVCKTCFVNGAVLTHSG